VSPARKCRASEGEGTGRGATSAAPGRRDRGDVDLLHPHHRIKCALCFIAFAQLLKSSGHWFNPQPWLLTFLRGSDAEKIAGEILAELTDADLGPFGRITYCPMFTSAIRTPLVRMPDEEVVFPFNLIRIPASNDSAQVERMIAQNRVLYERIRDAGGVLYPVSAIPMSPDDWKDHFGLKWRRFEEAARHFDPRSILTPGYDIFGRA
jgi:cytokinin dehydrogenase